eukprot:3669332-Rhodomonas_salina.2
MGVEGELGDGAGVEGEWGGLQTNKMGRAAGGGRRKERACRTWEDADDLKSHLHTRLRHLFQQPTET